MWIAIAMLAAINLCGLVVLWRLNRRVRYLDRSLTFHQQRSNADGAHTVSRGGWYAGME